MTTTLPAPTVEVERDHTTGASIAAQLRRLAETIEAEAAGPFAETTLMVGLQVGPSDHDAMTAVDVLNHAIHGSAPVYGRSGIYGSHHEDLTRLGHTWVNVYAITLPPPRVFETLWAEAHAEQAARAASFADVAVKPACADPIVAIAEGREINLITVGGYFRETWAKLPALRRAELVEACQVAGWVGDWDAAYKHVMGNMPIETLVAPSGVPADDARVVVSELDETVGVEPDAREYVPVDDDTAQAVAHRHEGAHYIEVTEQPAAIDPGRGGAGVKRMTGASS